MALYQVAKNILSLTYEEMMTLADSLSSVSLLNDEGEELEEPTVSRERMAACLKDWADDFISESEG